MTNFLFLDGADLPFGTRSHHRKTEENSGIGSPPVITAINLIARISKVHVAFDLSILLILAIQFSFPFQLCQTF